MSQALKAGGIGALTGAISAGFAHGIGTWANGSDYFSWGHAGQTAGEALLGGAMSEATGGDFGEGALSAGAAAALSPLSTFDMENPDYILARTAIAAAVGGTAAELGGGKFENGATTAAFTHLFNSETSAWGHLFRKLPYGKSGYYYYVSDPKNTASTPPGTFYGPKGRYYGTCVSLVKDLAGVPGPVGSWVPGAKVEDLQWVDGIEKGTAIAAFDESGKFLSEHTYHAGLFTGFGDPPSDRPGPGFWIFEQWKNPGDSHFAQGRYLQFNNGQERPDNGSSFSILLTK